MEYVCTGATLKCSMGTATSKLNATPKNVTLIGKDQANIADYVSQINVPSFGKCRSLAYPPTASATAANHGRLTPMPCIPGTCPKWQAVDKDSLVCGEPALLKPATLKCMYGGTISIVSPGQNKEVKSLSEMGGITGGATPIDVNTESVLDGIQLALDVAGFAPGVGAIPDLLNAGISALRGDWASAGLNLLAAVPLIGDVAKATKLAKKGLNSAKAVSNVVEVGNIANKSQRRAKLAKEASNFISTDVSANQLVKNGLSKSDADFFMKKVRYQRRNAAYNVYSKSPNVNKFQIESHLNGIDFSAPIEIGKFPKGTKVGMYINKDIKGNVGAPGNYAFEINFGKPIPTTNQLGVADRGIYRSDEGNYFFKKVLHEVELTDDVMYIKSTSRKIMDNWSDKLHPKKVSGGGEQLFLLDKGIAKIIKAF